MLSAENNVLKLFSSKKFSDTDNFQIRLEVQNLSDSLHGGNIHIGLGYPILEGIVSIASTESWTTFFKLKRKMTTLFYTKIDNIIYVSGYNAEHNSSKVYGTTPELGEMIFKILMNKSTTGIIRVSYKDLNN